MDNIIFAISGVLALYVLLPIFSVSFVVGYMFRIRTEQTLIEILKRAILITSALGLPNAIFPGKWMMWWLSGYSLD